MKKKSYPIMPKATAIWLIDNTTLTFKQIAEFCGLHELEIKAISNAEIATNIAPLNPVNNGQLTQEEIERCSKDPNTSLQINSNTISIDNNRKKGAKKAKYTPIARRQDKPDAIFWLVRNHPDMTDTAIGRLLGTTKNTISSIRNNLHWNMSNIKPRDPVLLGLCTQTDLDNAVSKIKKTETDETQIKEMGIEKIEQN